MDHAYQEKPFPYLPIALTLFVIGILLLGGVWVAAQNNTQNSTQLTNPVAVVTHPPSTVLATKKLNLETKNATVSSQQTLLTFPTKQLSVQIPAGWETTPGENDSHQIVNWWLVDNTVVIQSPDKKASSQAGCPEGGCPDIHGAVITISDYGASAFTTAKAWYEGKASKEASTATSSATPLSVTTATLASLPAYCVSPSSVSAPAVVGVPPALFTGTCYVIWKAHVYAVSATLDKTTASYQSNLSLTTTILKNIKLL